MHITGESLLVILIVGVIAGWLAGKIVEGSGFGLIGDMAVGPDRQLVDASPGDSPGERHAVGHHRGNHRRRVAAGDRQARYGRLSQASVMALLKNWRL